ncbi:AAA family ATPase [Streptomyces sp. BE133]|uniref:AAA family ATPase n=1 Tax=Streptomyces sp. BE133 TaxID=3002523 RepID=UPI002E76025F|nr:AAA family ATPase [Streptomyces sp. BE133]MEE1805420.1 AAA family ATPase [Streptomyces sp. BE133]
MHTNGRDIGHSGGRSDRASPRPFGADGPLIGRQADLDRIDAFLDDLPRHDGPLLLLGEPGVGKTALLAAAAFRAAHRGIHVLAATGAEYRTRLSHGGLGQLVEAAARAQPSVLPGDALAVALGRGGGPAPALEAVTDAVADLVGELARHAPTLLVVDDAQWLDAASARVLGDVARRLTGGGAALLCTARDGTEGSFDLGGLPVHEVTPLSEAASDELLVQRFPALAPRVRRRLMAEAQGNPLALLELPVALSGPQRSAATALPERFPLSRRLQSAFASRVTGLPAATRYLLLLAALDGTGDLQVLRRATAGRMTLKHLDPAERAQLIRIDEPSSLTFRHPLTRSAVVELSTSTERRSAHRALARAWQAAPERQAWYLAQAAEAPDEQVAALLERAAAVLSRRGDGPAAMAALLRAAELTPPGPERARRLAEVAYTGANVTGDMRDVPHLLHDARHMTPDAGPAAMVTAVAGAAYLLNGSGDIDTAHRLLRDAVALRPEPCDPADVTLTEALHTLLLVCFFGGRPELWPAFDTALAAYGAPPPLLATTRATLADPARAAPSHLAELDAAIARLPQENDPLHIVRVATAGAYVDRLDGCAEGLHRVVAGGRRGEHVTPAIEALFLLGNHAWLTGQWPELGHLAREGLDLCEQHDYAMLAWVGRYLLACTAAARGDHGATRELTDRMQQWAGPRRASTVRVYAAHARTLSALGQGDFETAYQEAILITPPGTLARHAPHALWTLMDLVDAAVRTGRHRQARDHADAARNARLDRISPRLAILVHASTALAADDDRHPGFQEALAVPGGERWPFDLARIHLYHGERLRRGGARTQARHHLGVAAEHFRRLSATPWTERAHQELRACGIPGPPASRSGTPVLTPQQREIANLAAAGLSNNRIAEKLFLSPRTVSTHLYQLFPKIGVTSRAGLRDALERLDQQ